MTKAKC